jgi:hypothetical protein
MTKQEHSTLNHSKKKSLLKSALNYAKRGFAVFPCKVRGKAPIGLLVPNGHLDATLDPTQIIAWWATHPRANIGLVPPEGYAVVDVDPRDGGLDTLKTLGEGAVTLKAFSGGEDHGHHLWYRYVPSQLPGALGPGIQLKANGHGYVIAPPSIHPSGGIYTWETEFDPSLINKWPKGLGGEAPLVTKRQEDISNTLTLSQLKGVLAKIPADSYADWVKVGQGIKSDYPDQFDIWEKWSETSKKFKSVADCARKWKTFKKEGVTTGTLVYMAGGKVPKASAEEDFAGADLLDEKPKSKEGLQVVNLEDVVAKDIDWLVPGYFARGMVHCIAGYGGAGKSLVVTSLIAALTKGLDWISGEKTAPPISVLMITEEQLQISVKPRMQFAQADMRRVNIIEAVVRKKKDNKGNEVIIPWNLDDHLGDTERWFKSHPEVKLLVIDPIGSFMEGEKREIDTWKDSNVRKVLDKWVKLAENLNLAIIYLAHFNKSKGARAADKITGSSAFTTVTRMTYVVGEGGEEWLENQGYPGGKDDRIMVGVKCNIGRKPRVLVIGLEPVPGNSNPKVFMKGPLAEGCQAEAEQVLMDGGSTTEIKKDTNADKVYQVLKAQPGLSRRELAKQFDNISESNMTRYIDKLEEQKLVRRLRNGNETWVFPIEDAEIFE